jgi:archaellum biogenesis ATPase FlaH
MKNDLYDKSPVRLFEKLAGGGLAAGEMGLVSAKKGLGKTAVMVQFGVDYLLQDKELVHVSFNQQSANVIGWYESIFGEVAKKKNIAEPSKILAPLVQKRIILNLNQDEQALSRIASTIKALRASGILTQVVLIDDIDFARVKPQELSAIHSFVKESGLVLWISAAYETVAAIPPDIHAVFSLSLHLNPRSDGPELQVVKLHGKDLGDIKVKLDSKTLLFTDK